MLDAKVLAAVFASLTAIATTMNGGSFEPDMAVEGVSSSGVDVNELSGSNSAFSTLENCEVCSHPGQNPQTLSKP